MSDILIYTCVLDYFSLFLAKLIYTNIYIYIYIYNHIN